MLTGAITGYIDVAQIVLYVFWAFFAGLLYYLQREGRREGFPLENDAGDKQEQMGPLWEVEPKTFKLAHGPHSEVKSGARDTRELALRKTAVWEGAPFEPTGDPMADGVGPASYAERHDHPDLTVDGDPKIVPLRAAGDFYPAAEDNDPRGMTVFGCDGEVAGTVKDMWVDKGEYLARYFEVDLGDKGSVLLPVNFSIVRGEKNLFTFLSGLKRDNPGIFVDAITAEQFAGVPRTAHGEQVTLLEEDKIMGYFGGGKLYATPDRSEPLA